MITRLDSGNRHCVVLAHVFAPFAIEELNTLIRDPAVELMHDPRTANQGALLVIDRAGIVAPLRSVLDRLQPFAVGACLIACRLGARRGHERGGGRQRHCERNATRLNCPAAPDHRRGKHPLNATPWSAPRAARIRLAK
jgi:hypothetical protein